MVAAVCQVRPTEPAGSRRPMNSDDVNNPAHRARPRELGAALPPDRGVRPTGDRLGRLRPGQRLPSVRAVAGQLGVGRLTVATAYESSRPMATS